MKEPLYRDVIGFGWRFALQHKFLWVYGLFAAALGHMGVFDVLAKVSGAVFRSNAIVPDFILFFASPQFRGGSWAGLFFGNGPDGIWFVWLALVGLGLLAFFAVVAVVSQGALIHAAAQGKSSRGVALDAREWHAGVNHFWRLFFLNFAKKCVIGFLALLVGWSAYTAIFSPTAKHLLVFLALFLLASLLGLILSFFVIYAAGYVVVEEYAFGEAVVSAWNLFVKHWLVSLEIGVIFLVFNILLAFMGALGFLVLLVPAALFWFVAIVIGSPALFSMILAFLLFCFVAFVMLISAVFTVFSTSVWTYAFMHMHRYGVKSRVLHWLSARGS